MDIIEQQQIGQDYLICAAYDSDFSPAEAWSGMEEDCFQTMLKAYEAGEITAYVVFVKIRCPHCGEYSVDTQNGYIGGFVEESPNAAIDRYLLCYADPKLQDTLAKV